jgi:hypothetical protein
MSNAVEKYKKIFHFLFKFTGDMSFMIQMTNIYSLFLYLKIYIPFLAKNSTSLQGLDRITLSSINFSYFYKSAFVHDRKIVLTLHSYEITLSETNTNEEGDTDRRFVINILRGGRLVHCTTLYVECRLIN